ncbi:DUF4097 family beta strand repeat-containing protein [Aureibaculum conchae]|uniref:hypothetical protein n=1 Tax=Aureibaculum sp. 2308TA14-22 TaxID=3108392 RepID=UPI003399B62F
MKKTILLLIFALSFYFSVQSQNLDYSFKETFKVEKPLNLTISSNNSDIEVIANEGYDVIVFYTVTKLDEVLKVTKKELEVMTKGQWKLDILDTSKSLEIKVVSTVKNGFTRPEDKIDVHFKVYVPRETSTELTSNDGNIKVQGLALDQKCISSDGNIHLTDLNGKVYAQTSDGNIILNNVTGIVESITHDGRVINNENKKSK